jgi:XTP/dITP diphosphohydrolase
MDDVILVATRSEHKLREIRDLMGTRAGVQLISLRDAGIEEMPEEEGIEVYDTFAENALAKARYFAERSGLPTLADDSGICVDALGGAPGVRSKRFSDRPALSGLELDAANNALLLERLADVPDAERSARFVCAAALVERGGGERVFLGECEGVILHQPRGADGFGYDPIFRPLGYERSFGEFTAAEKNEISHRATAFRAVAAALEAGVDEKGGLE